jgi:hypothetical protein
MLIFLLFLVGVLLGVVAGSALCVGYLRREIADDIGPKLKRMQLQLDNIEAELNLAVATRHAELSAALQAGDHVATCPRVPRQSCSASRTACPQLTHRCRRL